MGGCRISKSQTPRPSSDARFSVAMGNVVSRKAVGMATSKRSPVVLYLCRRHAVDARRWRDWMERAAMTALVVCRFFPPSKMRWADQWCAGGRSRRIADAGLDRDWTESGRKTRASLDGTRECLPVSANGAGRSCLETQEAIKPMTPRGGWAIGKCKLSKHEIHRGRP